MTSQHDTSHSEPDESRSKAALNIGSGQGQVTDSTVSVGDVAGRDIHKHTHIHLPPTPARKPPCNLPGAAPVFVGREAELAQILEALRPDPDRAHAVLIHGIRGMGGVGKTELALQAAWKLAKQYRDAQIFLECQVADAAKTPEALLGELIRAFAPEERPPESLAEAQARVRALLGGKRGLVVLDNAADGDQVRPVLEAIPGGWAVIVTSRQRFGLPHGHMVDLNVLRPEAAVALLRDLLGDRGDEAPKRRGEEAMLVRLAELCGYLPLALTIAGAFLVNHLDWTLEEYLHALEQARLAHLQEKGVGDVAGVLGLSLTQLERAQPELARRWRLLAVMPAPFDRAMAAAVWGSVKEKPTCPLQRFVRRLFRIPMRLRLHPLQEAETVESLSALVRWSLVEYDGESGLYNLHDLLRELAGPPDEAAVRRHAEHVLREAGAAEKHFLEGGNAVLEALARFEVLWPHLQAAWQRMRGVEDEEAQRWICDFGHAFIHLLELRTTPKARIPYLEAAVAAARALGDRRGEENALGNLGRAYADLGRVEEAIGYYEQALAIALEIGDRRNEGVWLGNLGRAYADLGRMEEAIGYHQQALAIAREIDDRRNEGVWLVNLGLADYSRGRMEEAIGYHQQALAIALEIGDRRTEGAWLGNLGLADYSLGRVEEAIGYYEQALAIARETGDRRMEGGVLGYLGAAHAALGRVEEAIGYYEQALAIAREIGDWWEKGTVLGTLGAAYFFLGRMEEAIEYYQQALAISREIGDRRREGNHLGNLGKVYADLGRVEEAIGYYEQALAIAREIGDRRGEGNHLGNLGRLYAEIGKLKKGLPLLQASLAIKRETGDRPGEGEALNYLGFAHHRLGNLEEALDFHRRGIALLRETKYRRPLGLALSDYAAALVDAGKLGDAHQAATEALTIAREIGDRFGEAQALRWLGRVALDSGDVTKACQQWRQALAIFEEIKSPHAQTVRRWLAAHCGA